MIIGIVAISRNYAIGKDGKLPWHYPADLKFFKETTTGNVVVMGATTWRSIGKPLPGRVNIVLSRSGRVEAPPGVLVLTSKADVIKLSTDETRDVFIIGGAQVFAEFADVIDRWIVTYIPLEVKDADTFMRPDFLDEFALVETLEPGDDLHVRILQRKP